MSKRRRIVVALLLSVAAVCGFFAWQIGPRNIIGMLLYDQRREGSLAVGDRAPDVALAGLDGDGDFRLADFVGGVPLVIVFGSFT